MEKQYKRTSRSVSPEVRKKVADSLRGRSRSEAEKIAISRGMKKYWRTDSNFPDDKQRHEGTGNGWIESGDIV